MLAASWCAAIVGLLGWVTVTGRECWPFSAYPMFSRPVDPRADIVVYRLQVEWADGTRTWWRTGDPTDQRDLGRAFAALGAHDPRAVLTSAPGRAWLRRVVALARVELGDAALAIVVVRRRADRAVTRVVETEVLRWPLATADRLAGERGV